MRPTGIVRRIDDLGRIVIPKGVREECKLSEGAPLEIFIDKGDIVLKKYMAAINTDGLDNLCEDLANRIDKWTDDRTKDKIGLIINSLKSAKTEIEKLNS